MKSEEKRYQRIISAFLSGILIAALFFGTPDMPVEGAIGKTLKMEQACSLALAGSEEYSKLNSQKNMKAVEYEAAVKAIKLKEQNNATFRFSPLISFKFPEKEKLSEEFENTFKPYLIQSQISALEHQLSDVKYSVREKVAILYANIYEKQQSIAFQNKKLTDLETMLKRKRAKAYKGKATKTDVEKIEKEIKTITATISSDTSTFLADKLQLGELIQLDISTHYTFENPFVQAKMEREDLDELKKRTLQYNQDLFEQKLTTGTKLTAMNTNFSLMKNQYGDKAVPLENYINQAKDGEKINQEALKSTYQTVLTSVEEPWTGAYKILFISIPKEWLKGAISGVRYMEDDPYVLYSSILEYQEAYQDQLSMEKELKQKVTDTYAALVAVEKAYQECQQNTVQMQKDVDMGIQMNLQGNMTLEELEKVQEEAGSARLDELKALSEYAKNLYSFDRMTCGGVTELMKQAELNSAAASGGKSHIAPNMVAGASYYIKSIVEDNSFELGIYIPEDYKIDVSAYELWVDNIQIGTRTEVDKTIVHLSLSTDNTKKVIVRLYNGEEFIDDCIIDPSTYSGVLSVTESYSAVRKESNVIGSFTYTTNGVTKISTLQLKLNADELAKSYIVRNAEGTDLLSGKKTDITSGFSYLSLAAGSINELQIVFFDKLGNEMYTARLDSIKLTINKNSDKTANE